MTFYETGAESLRAITYDNTVKQLAKYAYKFKQLVSVVPTGTWKDKFRRETLTIPAGISGNDTAGIPRGADFPNAVISWEQVTATIKKFGLEIQIDYEDIISSDFDQKDRMLQRLVEGIAKSVDTEICNILTESYTVSATQSATVSKGRWNESSGQIVKDIATMIKKVKAYYDNADNFALVVHPDVAVEIMSYVYEKGSQAPTLGAQMALNGKITDLAGASIITSNVMNASYALLVVPQRCATWNELVALGTDTISKKYKGDTITGCEMGTTKLTDPKAVVQMQVIA